MPIREVRSEEVDALADVLARAFDDDPVTRWVYPRDATRPKYSARFFAWQLRRLLPQDVTWTTQTAEGAAIWALPGQWREHPRDTLALFRQTARGLPKRRVLSLLRGLARVEARHPPRRHLYLAVLGVEPGRQGQGVGSELIRPGLELCDREGLPAYLETATERNVAFYGRHGFAVTEELRLPKGPPMWLMWREPGAR